MKIQINLDTERSMNTRITMDGVDVSRALCGLTLKANLNETIIDIETPSEIKYLHVDPRIEETLNLFDQTTLGTINAHKKSESS